MNVDTFFTRVWDAYVEVTPQAKAIYDLFTGYGENVVNDHVAFRTLSDSPIALCNLEPTLLSLGYRHQDSYVFEKKKLIARSYVHRDAGKPKIFLSELQRHQLSETAGAVLADLVAQIAEDLHPDPSIFYQGTLWRTPNNGDYQTLVHESEYAAWLVTMGLRANHFTVSVNHLQRFTDLAAVITLLKQNDYGVNAVGGEIKGSPDAFLEQAATLADNVWFEFADGERQRVPSCFYEFAKRYPTADGELFQGFVTGNADKIFESTNPMATPER